MDTYKETLQRRLFALLTYAGGMVLLVAFGMLRESAGKTEEVRAFMLGMNAGLLAVVLAVVISSAVRYTRALRDEEKRKALYIYEHDERRLYKQSMVGGTAVQLILMGLTVATVVSEYFDQTVFFTLLGTVLFAALVKAALKIYYERKIG